MSSPAPTSSANATAISTTTSPWPNRRPPADVPPRRSPSRTALASVCVFSRSTGHSPQIAPVTHDSTAANPSTQPSIAMPAARGSVVPASATKVLSAHCASMSPSAPPTIASTMLSIVSCRVRSHRVAPSADRTASSRRRASPAASSRLATFARRDQQHQRHRAHQHPQRLLDVADDGAVVRPDVDAVVVLELRRRASCRAPSSPAAPAPP